MRPGITQWRFDVLIEYSGSNLNTIEDKICRIAEIADNAKGGSITALDLRGICDFTDAFVIITATSNTHINSMMMIIDKKIRKYGIRPINKPDLNSGRWGLIDYSDIIVHLFESETRKFYALENLWGDAPRLEWEKIAVIKNSPKGSRAPV